MGFCLHQSCRCKAICSEGLVVLGGGMCARLPLVHVHVVHGCPEILRAAKSFYSERDSSVPTGIVEADPID